MLVEAVKRVVEEADAGNFSEICPSLSEGCGDDRRKRLSTSGIVENRHTAVSLLTATPRESACERELSRSLSLMVDRCVCEEGVVW